MKHEHHCRGPSLPDHLTCSHSVSSSPAPNPFCHTKAEGLGQKQRQLLCGVPLVTTGGGPGNRWHPSPRMQLSLLSGNLGIGEA